MKKLTTLPALILCALFCLSCSTNPYKSFDPEGAIIKNRIGMKEAELKKADAALQFSVTTADSVDYNLYSKDTSGYSVSYYAKDGAVCTAIYVFSYASADAYFNGVTEHFQSMKKAMGNPTENSKGDGDLSAASLKASNERYGVVLWIAKEKYSVLMTYGATDTKYAVIITIGLKKS